MIERGYSYYPPEGQPHPYDDPRMPFRDQPPYPRFPGAVNPAEYQNRQEYEAMLVRLNADRAYQLTAGQPDHVTAPGSQEQTGLVMITSLGQELRTRAHYIQEKANQDPSIIPPELPITFAADQQGAYIKPIPLDSASSYLDIRIDNKVLPPEITRQWEGKLLVAKKLAVGYNRQRGYTEVVYHDIVPTIDCPQPPEPALSVGLIASQGYLTARAFKLYKEDVFDPEKCYEQAAAFQAISPQSPEISTD